MVSWTSSILTRQLERTNMIIFGLHSLRSKRPKDRFVEQHASRVQWQGLAKALAAHAEIIQRHTTDPPRLPMHPDLRSSLTSSFTVFQVSDFKFYCVSSF